MYKIVGRLIDAGLVWHKRIYHDKPGIYYLTAAGAKHSPLPAIDRISKGIYDHQIKLIDVMLKLQERYPDTEWITDRYLVQQKFYYGVGRGGHVADGLLIFPDDRKVAIELELSVKGKRRLAKILSAYGSQLEIAEAWYFCAEEVIRPVTFLSKNKPYIKIHSLREFMHE